MRMLHTPDRSGDDGNGSKLVERDAGDEPGHMVTTADVLKGSQIIASDGENIGNVFDIVLDLHLGKIAYAVASSGGTGEMLRAIPWSAMKYNVGDKCFHLDVTAAHVKSAPGFDEEHWPVMTQSQWGLSLHQYYNRVPYWAVG
ncbi:MULTISPECIES: PRC-barrel domain-containing protein [Burkholderia]|uniref:PRC-barrel domain containing protein n=2 Tax=Burkholderia vietnamiensis TaxID=60552 RepID=A0A132DWT3_BURVI|nr:MULTISPECIES: PRC-barrel domain-containing protein [Burkholderia]KVR86925.1 photosystem reaction center subunit H [Burkholderia vietnamiensis]KVS12243.1 photosystem reaction center subunit H [Burkholderia vietnamiensis]MBR7908052.1 PRC-barrel domain-containing protein [Burkholderia vietnamiensis]MBR8003638.1 PRC-barrel domain-containing protein [Burkholderia vietnamiensis]MBR8055773.1 PRC-barrel domain-containing protein [Burkholderia vietnamiensis]